MGRVRHREWGIVGDVIHVLASGAALVRWDRYPRDSYYVSVDALEKVTR